MPGTGEEADISSDIYLVLFRQIRVILAYTPFSFDRVVAFQISGLKVEGAVMGSAFMPKRLRSGWVQFIQALGAVHSSRVHIFHCESNPIERSSRHMRAQRRIVGKLKW